MPSDKRDITGLPDGKSCKGGSDRKCFSAGDFPVFVRVCWIVFRIEKFIHQLSAMFLPRSLSLFLYIYSLFSSEILLISVIYHFWDRNMSRNKNLRRFPDFGRMRGYQAAHGGCDVLVWCGVEMGSCLSVEFS